MRCALWAGLAWTGPARYLRAPRPRAVCARGRAWGKIWGMMKRAPFVLGVRNCPVPIITFSDVMTCQVQIKPYLVCDLPMFWSLYVDRTGLSACVSDEDTAKCDRLKFTLRGAGLCPDLYTRESANKDRFVICGIGRGAGIDPALFWENLDVGLALVWDILSRYPMIKGVCVAMDQSSLFMDVLRDSRLGSDWRRAETLAQEYAITIMRQFERECPNTIRLLGGVVP